MPICMYPAIAAPERNTPNYALQGCRTSNDSIHQGSAVVPGEVVFPLGSNLITGHGTYRDVDESAASAQLREAVDRQGPSTHEDSIKTGAMRTSLTGRVRIVNKLVYVEPPKARYSGNVGDTVVGRIIEVEQRRWKVDINSSLLGNLALANVKLPGGELRRKSEDDERAMRSFMKEGDLIVAEVHEIYKDGTLQLHMPGTRTGKLGGGCLLRVPPSLVKRQKIHRHRLAVPRTSSVHGPLTSASTNPTEVISVGLILGCNGYVWIGPARAMDIGLGLAAPIESAAEGSTQLDYLAERFAVSRVRNCVIALTRNGMPVWETSVLAACEASWLADLHAADEEELEEDMDIDVVDPSVSLPTSRVRNRIARLLRPDVAQRLVSLVQAKLGTTT
ncbi:Exosome complex component RRP4 [Clonorchis sinensis]|uniref:Exosome complex component RRP4 n=2 Tax=Clonorchis sinensis TaxID=79923 RepID=G7YMP5_CLOSI|nr:Exosome complex component RRP4 [Clonorchis sinensis]GAA54226.1 exosome complex component RRP4 [Clonorchis sinensis]